MYKCYKCRMPLFHGDMIESHSIMEQKIKYNKLQKDSKSNTCMSAEVCSSYFLNTDDFSTVESLFEFKDEDGIYCLGCTNRLGTFNWNGTQCSCGSWIVPALKVIKSKITVMEEKKHVEEYVHKYKLESTLINALNRVVRERPENPYNELSNILKLEGSGEHKICNVNAHPVYDMNGCIVPKVCVGTDRGVFSSTLSNNDGHADTSIDEFPRTMQKLLKHKNPIEQKSIDDIIKSKKSVVGANGVMALSMAVCKAGAKHDDADISEHIRNVLDIENETRQLPEPVFQLLDGAGIANSSLCARGIGIVVKFAESVSMARNVANRVYGKVKDGILETNEMATFLDHGVYGGLCWGNPNGLQNAMQMVQDAILNVQGEYEEEQKPTIEIVLDVGAARFHQVNLENTKTGHRYDIGKWTPLKSAKDKPTPPLTSEELHKVYVKLVKEFPITTIIDPFVSEDKSSFVELKRVLNPDDGNRSSKKHKVQILVRDSLIVKGNIDYWTSDDAITGIILHSTTCINIHELCKLVHDAILNTKTVHFGISITDSCDTFLSELAIGLDCTQLFIGGVHHTPSVYNTNHLMVLSRARHALKYIGHEGTNVA